jgi:hypothetical protein
MEKKNSWIGELQIGGLTGQAAQAKGRTPTAVIRNLLAPVRQLTKKKAISRSDVITIQVKSDAAAAAAANEEDTASESESIDEATEQATMPVKQGGTKRKEPEPEPALHSTLAAIDQRKDPALHPVLLAKDDVQDPMMLLRCNEKKVLPPVGAPPTPVQALTCRALYVVRLNSDARCYALIRLEGDPVYKWVLRFKCRVCNGVVSTKL